MKGNGAWVRLVRVQPPVRLGWAGLVRRGRLLRDNGGIPSGVSRGTHEESLWPSYNWSSCMLTPPPLFL